MNKTIDITSHVKVPKHEKLSKEDILKLFERYNISILELPKISKKDPAIAQLSAEEGDVIKIIRISPTSGTSVYYRGVSSG